MNLRTNRPPHRNAVAPTVLYFWVIGCFLLLLLIALPVAAQTGSPDICSVFGPADVQPIVGVASGVPYKSGHLQVCTYSNSKTNAILHLNLNDLGSAIASTQTSEKYLKSTRDVAQMVEGTVIKDEPGMGDRAFSAVYTKKQGYMRTGVVCNILKDHRLITIEYWHDGDGTEKMRTLIEVLAKKAATAL